MTVDVVALCRRQPELAALLDALQDAGPGLRPAPHPSGMSLRLLDGSDRPVVDVEGPLLIRTPGEVRRLLGPAPVSEPVWWVEAHAGDHPDAAPVAYRFAAALAGGHDGVVRPAAPDQPAAPAPGAPVPVERDVVPVERDVVPLSRWLAGGITAAARESAPIMVITSGGSRITTPLESTLAAVGGRWVVRAGDGWHDGLSGERLLWSGTEFEPTGPAAAEPDPPAGMTCGTLRLRLVVLHEPATGAGLGGVTAEAYERLAGGAPAGWGVAEPASEPWSQGEVAGYCQRRAPEPSTLVVVGGTAGAPAVGTLTVSPQPAGLVEQLDLAVGCPDAPDPDQLAEHLAALETPRVRILLAALLPGRADCTIEPRRPG